MFTNSQKEAFKKLCGNISLSLFIGFIFYCTSAYVQYDGAHERVYLQYAEHLDLYIQSAQGGWLNNDNGRFSYNTAPLLEAQIVLYDLTKDDRYVSDMCEVVSRLWKGNDKHRKVIDSYRDGLISNGWSTTRYTGDSSRTVFLHTDALIMTPLIKAMTFLSGENNCSKIPCNIISLMEQHFVEVFEPQWIEHTLNSGYFADPFLINKGMNVPLNQCASVGIMCLNFYKITGRPKYKRFAEAIAKYVSSNFLYHEGRIRWYYKPPSDKYPDKSYDDFGHASLVYKFMYEAYESGVFFYGVGYDNSV